MPAADVHRAIDAVWRIESARLIAGLARIVRDVGLAEDLAQDALVAALEQWPESGVPDNPGAWLMGTAKHQAVDRLRRRKVLERKYEELARDMEVSAQPDLDAAIDDDIGDDLLSLIFTACHPVLSTEARIALTLRLVGALTTAEIARAFLVPESTVAQRIVRAKRTLAEARVPIEVPTGADRDARLSSVLEVVYAIFNEGYAAMAGDDWMRPALCEDALRGSLRGEAEVHGLAALMEIQASRLRARSGPSGEPVLLFRDGQVQRGARQRGCHAGRRGAASDVEGRARPVPRAEGGRRPVHGDQGAPRRVLAAATRTARAGTGSSSAGALRRSSGPRS